MQAFLRSHPWVILAAGAAIQIFTGVPAAWGVFQRGVCEGYGYGGQDAAMIFSFVICAFGIGCVAGGALQDKTSPRLTGWVGTALLSGGFVAAAFLPGGAPWMFWLAFSVPVGLGCALLYPSVMSCAQKWYVQRKGFATGVVGGAVGLSGAVLTLLGRWLIGTWSIRVAFGALGVMMAVVCGAACVVLVNPQAGDNADLPEQSKSKSGKRDENRAESPASKKQTANSDNARTPHENQTATKANTFTVPAMLRAPQYWLLTAAVFCAAPAMLLFSPIIVELGTARGLPEKAALACVAVGSVFSAAGRLGLPWCSDKLGRRAADLIAFAGLAAASVGLWLAQGWWVLAAYCVLALFYSGEAAVLPAMVTDLFGQKNTGLHYGLAALGMSAGSLAFPLLARLWDSVTPRHIIAVAAAAVGFVCVWLLKPTSGEKL